MENVLVKFIKPIALSVICFVSVAYLTKSIGVALIISLVPLLLGWLQIMESLGYALACIVFLSAVAWAATPAMIKSVIAEKIRRSGN